MPNLARIGGPAAFLALTALLTGLQTADRLESLAAGTARAAAASNPPQAVTRQTTRRVPGPQHALTASGQPLRDADLLLEQLASLSLETEPDAAALESLLAELARHGDGAIWSIRDFLLKTGGDYAATEDSALREVRGALLELLLATDLPDVELMAAELIDSTYDAREVWRLGRYLDSVRPGAYDNLIRHAGQQVLFASGDETLLPGEFFQLIGEAGDLGTAGLLLNEPMHRDAYVSVALALIPDGSGMPLVEEDARLFADGHYTQHGRLAIELLAQQAPAQLSDSQLLVDLAERHRIPTDLWEPVLGLVAGQRSITLEPPDSGWRQTSMIHRPEGNQSIFRIERDPALDSFETIGRRLMLLHQLLPHAPDHLRGTMTTATRRLCELYQQAAADTPTHQPRAASQLREAVPSCTRGRTS